MEAPESTMDETNFTKMTRILYLFPFYILLLQATKFELFEHRNMRADDLHDFK